MIDIGNTGGGRSTGLETQRASDAGVAQRKPVTGHSSSEKSKSGNSASASASASGAVEPTKLKPEKQKHLKRLYVDQQIYITSGIILGLSYADRLGFFPDTLRKFLSLSYYDAETGLYYVGLDDFYFVFTWVLRFILVRVLVIKYVLIPIAHWQGIRSSKAVVRFVEQGWYLVYYGLSWVAGMYLYVKSDYFLNMDNLWVGWPEFRLTQEFKMYYLLEMAVWFQQLFVLNVEERRKDYYQMFVHHIVTCWLIIGSYFYYFSRIGHMILAIMDFVDTVLSLAKMLKYCKFQKACDVMFGVFFVSWVILRHGLYNYLFYFSVMKADLLMGESCPAPSSSLWQFTVNSVQSLLNGDQPVISCYDTVVLDMFFWLLGALQLLMMVWMMMIIRVAFKVARGKGADDVRSDEEDDM